MLMLTLSVWEDKNIYNIHLNLIIFGFRQHMVSQALVNNGPKHLVTGFYTKGRPLVKSNLICPLDKLSWQPGCPVLNINIQGNFCIS